jgi:hypothetical protein
MPLLSKFKVVDAQRPEQGFDGTQYIQPFHTSKTCSSCISGGIKVIGAITISRWPPSVCLNLGRKRS